MTLKLISKFCEELTHFGEYTFEGPIGQEYQPFIDYWTDTVCRNLGHNVTEKDRPDSEHPLVQAFFEEQLSNGRYTLDVPMGKEYEVFVKYWEEVSIKLGSIYPRY